MSNVIKITDKNGNIQELQVDKNLELSIQSGDFVFIDELLNAVQLEIINNDNLRVVFPNGNEVVLNDIAKLISENPAGEIAPQFSDEELINSLTTKLEFLQNDLFDEGAVISNYAELLNALEAAAAGQDVLEDGSAAPEINIGEYNANANEYELGHLRTAQVDLNDDLVPGEALEDNAGTGTGTGADATPLNTVVSLSATDTDEDIGEIVITATLTNAGETDVTITTEHGDIIIPAGETTGTLVVDVGDSDVFIDPETFSATVSEVTGGNFDNVDFSNATTTAEIFDTIDTTTATLTSSISGDEDGATVTYTVTLSNAPTEDETFTFEVDGVEQTITVPAGQTTGTTTVDYADADVFKDESTVGVASNFAASDADGASNYESLTLTNSADGETLADTIDTTEVKLEATPSSVAEGGVITYTASVEDAPQNTPLVVTLSNGVQITIPVGALSASEEYTVPSNDVANEADKSLEVSIDSATGGNYEKLDTTATITTTVTEGDFDNDTYATVSIVDSSDANDVIDASEGSVEKATISGEIEPGASITSLKVTDGVTTITIDPSSVTVNADGTFTIENFDVSTLKDGELKVELSSEDAYGNTADADDTVDKDTVATISVDDVDISSTADATFTAYAYNGDNFMTGNGNSLGHLKFQTNETAISTEHGVGIQNNQNESQQGIDDNETLVIALNDTVTSATFNLNVANDDDTFEGQWIAFDKDGNEIASGTSTFNSTGDTSVTISGIGEFAYVAFDAHSTNGKASDDGFFVEPVSYVDAAGVTKEFDETTETIDVSGTTTDVEEGQTVTIELTDGVNTITTTTTVGADGSYNLEGYDVSSLNSGEITVKVSTEDKAGNPASDSTTADLTPADTTGDMAENNDSAPTSVGEEKNIDFEGILPADDDTTVVTQKATNVVIALDVSGSMTNWSGKVTLDDGTVTDRLALAKESLKEMIETYKDNGGVNVKLTTFSSTASATGWMTAEEALAKIESLESGGNTNYEDALFETYDTYTPAPNGEKVVVYFISDGEPNRENKDVDGSGSNQTKYIQGEAIDDGYIEKWKDFLTDNATELNVIGIGTGLDENDPDFERVAVEIGSIKTNVLVVEDVTELKEVLVDSATAKVEGNVLDNVSGGDGEISIQSITIDGVEYTEDTFPEIGVKTESGSKIMFDFETGDYKFIATADNYPEDASEIFSIKAADSDGDTTEFDVKINVNVADDVPTSTEVTLTASDTDEDVGEVTLTATMTNTGDSDVVVSTEHGDIIIPAGEKTGTLLVDNLQDSDVYNDADTFTTKITDVTGGGFDNISYSQDDVTSTISDTIDVTTVSITGTVTTPSTIDVTNVKGEPNGINVYALDLNGDVQDLSVVKGTNHDGFGVNGHTSGSGASSELGHGSNGVSEKVVVDFDTEVKTLDVSFAWRNNRETAKVTFFDDEGEEVGSATVSGGGNNNEALITYYDENGIVTKVETAQGGSDKVDLSYKFEPGNGQTFSKVEFSAPGYDDDYLINKITYKEVVTSDVTDVVTNNGEVTLEIQTSNPPQAGTTATAVVEVGGKEYNVQLDVNGRGTLNVEVDGNTDLTATVKEIIGGNFEAVDTTNANWDLASELISLDDTIAVTEDQTYYLDTTDFGDAQVNVTQVQITEVPVNGTLYMNSGNIVETIVTNDGKQINVYENKLPITAGTVITMADIASGKVSFEPNANSDADGSFKFKADDGNGNFHNTEHTTTIDVTAVADAPLLDMSISDAVEVSGGVNHDYTATGGSNFNNNNFVDGYQDTTANYKNINQAGFYMGSGDDTVTASKNANNATFDMGSGDDVVYIKGEAHNINISGGTGNDSVVIDGSFKHSTINTGSGNDYVELNNLEGNANINFGSGDDVLKLSGNKSDYGIIDNGNGNFKIVTGNFTLHDNGYSQWITGGAWTDVTGVEAIVFDDGTVIGDASLVNSGETSYEYTIDLSAQLTDTDGSETLSDITLTNIPAGSTLKDSNGNEIDANDDGSYTVQVDEKGGDVSVTLSNPTEVDESALKDIKASVTSTESSPTEVDESALKDIKASVTSTEENGGDTETVSATEDSFIIEEDTVLDFDSLSQDQLPQASTMELGNGAQTLENVEYQDILSMASTDDNAEKIFKILGDGDDTVNLKDGEGDNKWTKSEEQFTDDEGETFDVYTNQDLTVFIDSDTDTNITGGI